MGLACPVEVAEEEDLITSGARGDEDGVGVRVRAKNGAVLACPEVDRGVDEIPKVFLAACWRPCSSFSANKARWSNRLVAL